MKITSQRCTCLACMHVFDAQVVESCPVSVWAASVQAIRCPKCGDSKIAFGGMLAGGDDPSGTVSERAARWFTKGEGGLSSHTIYNAMLVPHALHLRPYVPHDPDDFRRCRQLLNLIPEWKLRMSELAERYPMWKPFVDAWGELDAIYDKYEASSGSTGGALYLEALYARMTELGKESMLIAAAKGR